MISKYLKSKNLISQIKPSIDETELNLDSDEIYYYLNTFDCTSTYYFYRNLFSDYDLERILAIGNKLPKKPGELNSKKKLDESIRESIISWIPVNSQTTWIYQNIVDCIHTVNDSYFNYDLTKMEKLQFTRYYGNNHGVYRPHVDSNFGHIPENRKLTFVMQLSDPSEYEGGELRLHLGKDPDIIPKEKGLTVFFPSSTLHECTPVTSGRRTSLVGWVCGPKFR
jgi:PKHD-type hydroxylase